MIVRRLGEETLAQQVYEEQRSQNWPGLAKETETICSELGIQSVHTTNLSAKEYRGIIVKACHLTNEVRLKKDAEGKDKCERIFREPYGRKEYVKNKQILNVRQAFKTRHGLQPFAGNFSHDMRFAKTDWLCRCKNAKEDENHLLSGNCELYGSMRDKYGDLREDENLVKFFTAVLEMRDKFDENNA